MLTLYATSSPSAFIVQCSHY